MLQIFHPFKESFEVERTFTDDDILMLAFAGPDEVLEVEAVGAVCEKVQPADGVLSLDMDAPGCVQAEADALGAAVEYVAKHGGVAEPVVSAMVVDGNRQPELFAEPL